MLQKFIHRIVRPRHFWRDVGFDELSEIYANNLIGALAISLMGIFIPVYLYETGYSVAAISAFYFMFFCSRAVFDIAAAFMVGRFGAKRIMLTARLTQVSAFALLATLQTFQWPLMLCSLVLGAGSSMYFIGFHTDFSKVKHRGHGGKELGWATNFEKIGGVIGPVAGGVLATVFSPQTVFVFACVLLFCAAVPFFATREAIKTRQKITFRGLPIRERYRDYLAYIGVATENTTTMALWPLYLTVVLASDHIYSAIGLLASIGVASSFVFIHAIGKLIDSRRARSLYNYGVAANALVHFARPLATTITGAAIVNIANEQATNSYRLPFIKAFYDTASDLPGYRIAYISTFEATGDVAKSIFWGVLSLLALHLSTVPLLKCAFVGIGILSLLMYMQNFKALRR